jgi:hypothetical protein
MKRPKLTSADRLLWVWLCRVWSDWRSALIIVQPDTVVAWHRKDINHAGTVFSAYGFTLEDIIVRAWEVNRWHVDITPGLRDDARFDFLPHAGPAAGERRTGISQGGRAGPSTTSRIVSRQS